MQPSLAALLELKMFDSVGDEDTSAINAGFLKGFIEHVARGTNERQPLEVLLMTGLFAYQHQVRRSGPPTRHDLGCGAIEPTPPTFGLGVVELFQREIRRLLCGMLDH